MTVVFAASRIAELALQKIGFYGLNQATPTEAAMSRAIDWMDLAIGTLAETEECLWLRRTSSGFALRDGVSSYNLLDELAADATATAELTGRGIAAVSAVFLASPAGERTEIERIDAAAFQRLDTAQVGRPCVAYIDRRSVPTIHLHPGPGASGIADWRILLNLDIYATQTRTGGRPGDASVDIPPGWQEWLIHATAASIGDGPVTRLENGVMARLQRQTEILRARLLAHQNRAKDSRVSVVPNAF